MYAVQVLGMFASNGPEWASHDAAKCADALLAGRRERFQLERPAFEIAVEGARVEQAYARGKADGAMEERERIAQTALKWAEQRSKFGPVYKLSVVVLESFAAHLRSPADQMWEEIDCNVERNERERG
jgi:hypothetical protein